MTDFDPRDRFDIPDDREPDDNIPDANADPEWVVVNAEFRDQQADLPSGLWAQIGPESDGRWSWTVLDFPDFEIDSGYAPTEDEAKTAAVRAVCPAGGPHTWVELTAWEAGPGNDPGGWRCDECGIRPPEGEPHDL